MDEIATEVRDEHLKTGRRVSEIVEAMRDEGYLDLSDEEAAIVISMASRVP